MWLKEFSNFHLPAEHPGIVHDLICYPTVEHFFAAMKAVDISDRIKIARAKHPAEAKKLGTQVELRPEWSKVRRAVSWYGLQHKFGNDANLAWLLIDSGDEEIIHRVHWHDNFWAACQCPKCVDKPKHNVLGEQLMKLRSLLVERGFESIHETVQPHRTVYFGTPCKIAA